MIETSNFPPLGETKSYYCKTCQKVVDWEIIEQEGEYYWYAAECNRKVKIGSWPETEIED